jgi:tetratricopeptide (TPR) repeat protein
MAPPPDWQERWTTMSKQDDILVKVQAAQSLCSEDPEKAEVFLRSALKDAEALGQSSATLHLQLAELLFRLRRTRQALAEVGEVLALDPFNLVALNLRQVLGRRLR